MQSITIKLKNVCLYRILLLYQKFSHNPKTQKTFLENIQSAKFLRWMLNNKYIILIISVPSFHHMCRSALPTAETPKPLSAHS